MDKKLQLPDFARIYAEKTGEKINKSEEIAKNFISVIKDVLVDGDELQFNQFGTFSVKTYPEGTLKHNPSNNEKVDLSGVKVPKFRFSPKIKELLND